MKGTTKLPKLPALDDPNIRDKKLEFFMTASHQLKGPVAIILWCLESLQEQNYFKPADAKLIGQALMQATSMNKLISDMLQVFRLLSGREALELTPVELNPLIDAVYKEYELKAHNKGVHLLRGKIEHLPPVLAKETLLKQCITNLVDNGIKYTPTEKSVTVNAYSEDGLAVIEVHDQGIGISEADQGRLFTEFFRSEEAKSFTSEGTGLGLVLVKQIAESMGGSVTLKSRLHHGSVFTLTMPTVA